MENFSKWFIDFFREFILDIWNAIKGFFIGIYNLLIGNPLKYLGLLKEHSATFGALDWFLSIVFLLVFLVVVLMLLIVIIQVLRRYMHFSKIETDKVELLNRLSMLERSRKNVGVERPTLNIKQTPTKTFSNNRIEAHSRFSRLNYIDQKYKFTILPTIMKEEDKLDLSQIVTHFKNFASYNLDLYYDEKVIATFLAGMATSKVMILEGISGTGKTSLPYAFGKFFSNDASIISVQPSWRDRFEMMGYLNEFTKRFNETEFLKALYEATYRTDVNIIVLDEMNLARVEYYFADFLSLLELPNSDEHILNVVPDTVSGDPINLKNGSLKIPSNVWFIGTANKDDSTFTITDKVYDRAASIEMNEKANAFEAPKTESLTISYKYLNELFIKAKEEHRISGNTLESLNKLDSIIIKNFEITFGNRIMKQILNFVPVYIATGRDEVEALDYLISRKIIRKFESLNLPFLKKELEELLETFDKLFGKDKMVDSKQMITKYINQI